MKKYQVFASVDIYVEASSKEEAMTQTYRLLSKKLTEEVNISVEDAIELELEEVKDA